MEQNYVIFETRCIHRYFSVLNKNILYRASDFISTFSMLSNPAIVFPNTKLHKILFPHRARVGD